MKIVVLVAVLGASAPLVEAAQARRPAAPPPAQAPARLAQAYDQFLRAHMLEEEDVEGASAAYRRAMALDPTASAIPADLADLLMREGRANEAAFSHAVEEISQAARRLLDSLQTTAPARDREIMAQKARERSKARFG